MKLTRRKMATAVLATVAGTAALTEAQQSPSSPEQELQAARDRMKATGDALAAQNLPIATEPAFQFKA